MTDNTNQTGITNPQRPPQGDEPDQDLVALSAGVAIDASASLTRPRSP